MDTNGSQNFPTQTAVLGITDNAVKVGSSLGFETQPMLDVDL